MDRERVSRILPDALLSYRNLVKLPVLFALSYLFKTPQKNGNQQPYLPDPFLVKNPKPSSKERHVMWHGLYPGIETYS